MERLFAAALLFWLASPALLADEPKTPWEHLAAKYDSDGDGFIDQTEVGILGARRGRRTRKRGAAPRARQRTPDFQLRQIDSPGVSKKQGAKTPTIKLSSYGTVPRRRWPATK